MSDITPLATYHNSFRLAFWPEREPASDLLATGPETQAVGVSSTDSNYQPVTAPVAAEGDLRPFLPPWPGPLTFSSFGGACLP